MENSLKTLKDFSIKHPKISIVALQVMLFIWYYLSFHYINATDAEKNIDIKRLFIKWLIYMTPYYIFVLTFVLYREQITNMIIKSLYKKI